MLLVASPLAFDCVRIPAPPLPRTLMAPELLDVALPAAATVSMPSMIALMFPELVASALPGPVVKTVMPTPTLLTAPVLEQERSPET